LLDVCSPVASVITEQLEAACLRLIPELSLVELSLHQEISATNKLKPLPRQIKVGDCFSSSIANFDL